MMADMHTTLSELLHQSRTRRRLVSMSVSMLAAWLGMANDVDAASKRKRRRKRRRKQQEPIPPPPPPPQPNAFGCLDVGVACGGQSSQCCSSICEGGAPAPGEPDTSACVAHNTGGCQVTDDSCGFDRPEIPCGNRGLCLRTTGNAGFCARSESGECSACRRDEDCQGAFGPGAACLICETLPCELTGRRACAPPAA
jgi:hypothetical protein